MDGCSTCSDAQSKSRIYQNLLLHHVKYLLHIFVGLEGTKVGYRTEQTVPCEDEPTMSLATRVSQSHFSSAIDTPPC
jgi:hypothetical protein